MMSDLGTNALQMVLQVTAHEKSQKYKEGKFILERAKLLDSAQEEKMSQQSSESLEEEESDAEEACI